MENVFKNSGTRKYYVMNSTLNSVDEWITHMLHIQVWVEIWALRMASLMALCSFTQPLQANTMAVSNIMSTTAVFHNLSS